MTYHEYQDGLKRLSDFFPTLVIKENTEQAWYAALQRLSPEVFFLSLKLIAANETQWFPNHNLVGLVGKYKGRASEILWRRREAKRERLERKKLAAERLPPEQTAKLVRALCAKMVAPK